MPAEQQARLEQLELHSEQEKESLKSDVVQAEEELCRYVYQCKPQQQSLNVRLIMMSSVKAEAAVVRGAVLSEGRAPRGVGASAGHTRSGALVLKGGSTYQ